MNAPFSRNAGADTADKHIVMPHDVINARTRALSIGELLGRLEAFTENQLSGAYKYPWATRFAMGYPLPSWQRPLVWTPMQKVRFIYSIWSGGEIGSYLVNDIFEFVGDDQTREFTDVLLDGQQRLTTLEEYVTDRFAVPDREGTLRFWSELPPPERRRFARHQFSQATVSSWDEKLLRLAYDLRAFGGTAHNEDQRASV